MQHISATEHKVRSPPSSRAQSKAILDLETRSGFRSHPYKRYYQRRSVSPPVRDYMAHRSRSRSPRPRSPYSRNYRRLSVSPSGRRDFDKPRGFSPGQDRRRTTNGIYDTPFTTETPFKEKERIIELRSQSPMTSDFPSFSTITTQNIQPMPSGTAPADFVSRKLSVDQIGSVHSALDQLEQSSFGRQLKKRGPSGDQTSESCIPETSSSLYSLELAHQPSLLPVIDGREYYPLTIKVHMIS
ncbi:hypothetical protein K435DRAFT_435164 [Dendrothele bispora CBS 962.96]|uniref:Uncharacterized protein n=1 Tax=Dendrothele bispora (strain CBS 962.96) TaxID=1314807 RepID=A0A4S8L3Z5_DENBC|nr:hypothetical protein K435DRAFT_435164 [Dendrothele bispora CBS 962.96]